MNFTYLLIKKMEFELVFEKWVKFEWMEMNEVGMEKEESMLCLDILGIPSNLNQRMCIGE